MSWEKNNFWKVKPIKMRFSLDTDKDGVIDRKDCRPFNPKKQHVYKDGEVYDEDWGKYFSYDYIPGEYHKEEPFGMSYERRVDKSSSDIKGQIRSVGGHTEKGTIRYNKYGDVDGRELERLKKRLKIRKSIE